MAEVICKYTLYIAMYRNTRSPHQVVLGPNSTQQHNKHNLVDFGNEQADRLLEQGRRRHSAYSVEWVQEIRQQPQQACLSSQCSLWEIEYRGLLQRVQQPEGSFSEGRGW